MHLGCTRSYNFCNWACRPNMTVFVNVKAGCLFRSDSMHSSLNQTLSFIMKLMVLRGTLLLWSSSGKRCIYSTKHGIWNVVIRFIMSISFLGPININKRLKERVIRLKKDKLTFESQEWSELHTEESKYQLSQEHLSEQDPDSWVALPFLARGKTDKSCSI